MGKQIDNSYTEDVNYVTAYGGIRTNRWAASSNAVQLFIDAIGISNDFNPRQSMVVNSTANTLVCTPTAGNGDADYWWVMVTDGDGNFAHGEVTDLATPGTVSLSTVNFNYQKDWLVTMRVRKTGDERDVVIVWNIANPAEDVTVAIPAGYHN